MLKPPELKAEGEVMLLTHGNSFWTHIGMPDRKGKGGCVTGGDGAGEEAAASTHILFPTYIHNNFINTIVTLSPL